MSGRKLINSSESEMIVDHWTMVSQGKSIQYLEVMVCESNVGQTLSHRRVINAGGRDRKRCYRPTNCWYRSKPVEWRPGWAFRRAGTSPSSANGRSRSLWSTPDIWCRDPLWSRSSSSTQLFPGTSQNQRHWWTSWAVRKPRNLFGRKWRVWHPLAACCRAGHQHSRGIAMVPLPGRTCSPCASSCCTRLRYRSSSFFFTLVVDVDLDVLSQFG